MFDYEGLAKRSSGEVARLVADTYRGLVERETGLLELAAHWTDLHSADLHSADLHSADPAELDLAEHGSGPPQSREQYRHVGGDGTPRVAEFAAAELATLQETTTTAALAQMADALDLRHRLPRLWRRVRAGQVRGWKARTVAQATRHLTVDAAAQVDQTVAGVITSVSWARCQNLLTAALITADPDQADEQARLWAAERFVRAGRSHDGGLKLLIARVNAGDVIWFLAMVNRIADISTTTATPTPPTSAAPKPSASSPNPPTPSNCSKPTSTTPAPTSNPPTPTTTPPKPATDPSTSTDQPSTPTRPDQASPSTSTSPPKPSPTAPARLGGSKAKDQSPSTRSAGSSPPATARSASSPSSTPRMAVHRDKPAWPTSDP